MKKALFAVVAVAVAASFALPAFAEKEAKSEKSKSLHFVGEVAAVDAAAKTVTIKNQAGDSKTFAADKAKVATAEKKKDADLADLKVGDKVSVSYTEDGGKNVASKIGVPAALKEKKVKEEKAH
jgi:Cu/Ag efflux protein CusF